MMLVCCLESSSVILISRLYCHGALRMQFCFVFFIGWIFTMLLLCLVLMPLSLLKFADIRDRVMDSLKEALATLGLLNDHVY